MKNLFNSFLENNTKRKWFSIFTTILIAGLLTIWGIHGIGEYGIALFILTPLFMGICSTILYGFKNAITFNQAWQIGFLTLGLFSLSLLLFAVEGLICIAMAAPFGLALTWIGSLIGYLIIKKKVSNPLVIVFCFIILIPLLGFTEKVNQENNEFKLRSVVTSIEIEAPAEAVWKNVIEFPELDKPKELIFRLGIAYPINAKIEGTGVGAIRHCNFTTGSFIEPITAWDENRLLKFDVLEQPAPMKELSFWNVNAPHLHDYFVSKRGQFQIIPLPNGKIRLVGTTWYYHNIQPAEYWQLWSDAIIHKIHLRVLGHIKLNAEKHE